MNVTSEPTVSVPPRWAMSTPSIVRGIDSSSRTFLQPLQALARVDVEDLGLGVLGEVAAEVEVLERLDLVAEPGGLLELEGLARLLHLLLHLREDDVLLAVEEEAEPADVLAVGLAVDPQVARGGALVDRVQQAGAEPPPAGVVLLDVERAGAELEDLLEDLDRPAQALGPGERAVELDPRSSGSRVKLTRGKSSPVVIWR